MTTAAPFHAQDQPVTIEACSHEAARYAVMHWHYSKQMPKSKLYKVGLWEGTQFMGAVMFGSGAAPTLLAPYGLKSWEGAELVRVALCDDHATPTTQVVAGALRVVHRANPGLRVIVSFADAGQGHLGTIYQAGNWLYLGQVDHQWYRVNGQLVHPKSLYMRHGAGGQSIPWLRANVDPAAERVPMPPKYRYVMPLDRAMRRQLAPLAQAYPKAPA